MINLSVSDYGLLMALQENASLSQIELAQRSGLSRTSVWRRIHELEEAGIIENRVALLNPKSLGLLIHVLLSVSMIEHSEKIRKSFETYVSGLPEVMECFSVSGERDYVLQIISRDMESYNGFLNEKILHHSSVRSASSSFALRRVKYTTVLPL
jgi:DNA-binding Lrp family transcriptional regulator